jgi:voltage-gated potassium channel Kch
LYGGRILILGFRTASSLLEEVAHRKHAMLEDVAVVDFNPEVFKTLAARGIRVDYGDISQRDTLIHPGVQSAQILVCTLPDALLKGMSSAKMVRQLRELNPGAKIIVTADVLTDVPSLYSAGADYVSVGRLDEAANLYAALEAADAGLLEKKRAQLDARLANRDEVVP